MDKDKEVLRTVCFRGRAEKSLREELMEEELKTILLRAGIYPKLVGYDYLIAALKIAVNDPCVVKNVTNLLYPVVAEHFGTSVGSVERGIRHALEVSCKRDKLSKINDVVGADIFASGDRPTNAEFLSLVALRLSSAYNKRKISGY